MKKNIILCADDYGISHSVDRAIIDLLDKNRLSAVSCMTSSNIWANESKLLKKYVNKIDIGLHFSLTSIKPIINSNKLTNNNLVRGPGSLTIRAFLRMLDYNIIKKEFIAQIKAFEKALGKKPDYIDGHHHVHQLPIIKKAVVNESIKLYNNQNFYIRNTLISKRELLYKDSFFKKIPMFLSGLYFYNYCLKRKINTNKGFSGAYNYNSKSIFYKRAFIKFLKHSKNQSIIMCHPGFVDSRLKKIDSLTEQRKSEYDFLISDDFLDIINKYNINISKFSF